MCCLKATCCVCLSSRQDKPLILFSVLDEQQLNCYRVLTGNDTDLLPEEECSRRTICVNCSYTLQSVSQFRAKCISNAKALLQHYCDLCINPKKDSKKTKIVTGQTSSSSTCQNVQVSTSKTNNFDRLIKVEHEQDEHGHIDNKDESRINEANTLKNITWIKREDDHDISFVSQNVQPAYDDDPSHHFEHIKVEDTHEQDSKNVNMYAANEENRIVDSANTQETESDPLNPESPYKCTICHTWFAEIDFCRRHIKQCPNRTDAPTRSTEAELLLADKDAAAQLHSSKRKNGGKLNYVCYICGKNWSKKALLEKHVRIHTGEKPFSCEVCGKAFNRQDSLNTHARIHTGEKRYKCDVCNKEFHIQGNLRRHVRVHTGEKPYKCSFCSDSFTQKINLTRHTRIHTGEKPHQCEVCNKRFNDQSELNKHKRLHTGDSPYKCDICERSFYDQRTLVRHMTIHTGEKPFKCTLCDEGFNDRSGLIRHMEVHTGEKPIECKVCEQVFSSERNLIRHNRIHTE